MKRLFVLCLFPALLSGCLTASVVSNKGSFLGPALPASIQEWERSNKQSMIDDHLNQAIEAYRLAPPEEKAQRWEDVRRIQGLYEAGDQAHVLESPIAFPPNGPRRIYHGLHEHGTDSVRSIVDIIDKRTGILVTSVEIRGSQIPSGFTRSQAYEFRIRPLL